MEKNEHGKNLAFCYKNFGWRDSEGGDLGEWKKNYYSNRTMEYPGWCLAVLQFCENTSAKKPQFCKILLVNE